MFNVEMQRSGNRTLQGIRIAFYASSLFSSQPMRGVDFSKLKPIWVLMIADFPFLMIRINILKTIPLSAAAMRNP